MLGEIIGRKIPPGSISRGVVSVGRANNSCGQHQDVANANRKVAAIKAGIAVIDTGLEMEISKLGRSFDPALLALEIDSIKPRRTDVRVLKVALLWLPFDLRGKQGW